VSQRDARAYRQAHALYQDLRDNVTDALGQFFTIMRGLEARLVVIEEHLGIKVPGVAPPKGPGFLQRLFGAGRKDPPVTPGAVPAPVTVVPARQRTVNGEPIPDGSDEPTAPGVLD
jgi:hypothetical protein